MLLNRIDSIPASEKAGTLYLRIYPYVDPDKITTMFLFATSPLLSQSGNTKSSIKGNTLNSDSLNRKSPCSSSLYKRRHCLPSVTSQMRLLISWSSSLDGQTGIQSTIRNFTSNLLHIKKALGFGASWSSSLHQITPSKAAKRWNSCAFFVNMTQKLDCAFQNPTAFNFFILSRFKIREEWTYRSSVMVVVACPSTSESDLISNPTSTARVANV